MIYIDTSAFVPMFIREPKSDSVVAWLEASTERLAISEWTLVEFTSAAALKVRTKQVEGAVVKTATARAHEFARSYCTVALPGQDQYRRAAELGGDPALKLRAGDALHLAIAGGLSVRAVLCLDEDMIESAEKLGMSIVTF
jgi:predicted nucleic acid-binding protein